MKLPVCRLRCVCFFGACGACGAYGARGAREAVRPDTEYAGVEGEHEPCAPEKQAGDKEIEG